MIIVCDNCGTRYQIEESDIREGGLEVKCSKCEYVWFQSPFFIDDLAINAGVDKESLDGVTCHKAQKSKEDCNLLKYSLFTLVILICLSLFMIPRGGIHWFLRPLYAVFAIYDSVDLEFESARFNYKNGGILIDTTIVNNSNEEKVLPNMKISLYDGENNTLRTIKVIHNKKYINRGEQMEVTQQIHNVPIETKYIVLDIGNRLEMWF